MDPKRLSSDTPQEVRDLVERVDKEWEEKWEARRRADEAEERERLLRRFGKKS